MGDKLEKLREQVESHNPHTLATSEDWNLLRDLVLAIADRITPAREQEAPSEDAAPTE